MAKYQIWNRKDVIITPSGEVFTPDQWIAKHPICGIETIKMVISGSTINGSLLYEFNSFKQRLEKMGCDFSGCETDQEYLDKIEVFEKEQSEQAQATEEQTQATQERIAAALEAQVLLSLPDEE